MQFECAVFQELRQVADSGTFLTYGIHVWHREGTANASSARCPTSRSPAPLSSGSPLCATGTSWCRNT